ncbi:hypothetical protein BJV77DRAFT_987322 [Russula vinacea]|nr:hypothetical protein BJV77DRAFT_987322 [Russula vinacea]
MIPSRGDLHADAGAPGAERRGVDAGCGGRALTQGWGRPRSAHRGSRRSAEGRVHTQHAEAARADVARKGRIPSAQWQGGVGPACRDGGTDLACRGVDPARRGQRHQPSAHGAEGVNPVLRDRGR